MIGSFSAIAGLLVISTFTLFVSQQEGYTTFKNSASTTPKMFTFGSPALTWSNYRNDGR